MAKNRAELDAVFFALSDPTRRQMIERLLDGSKTVAELAEPFDVSAPAISKHLRVLERAGILEQHREGKARRCRVRPETLRMANAWMERHRRFWEQQLDRLAEYLAKSHEASNKDSE